MQIPYSVRYKGRRLFFGGCYPRQPTWFGSIGFLLWTAMSPAVNPNPDRARRGANVVSKDEAKDEFVPEPLLRSNV